MKRLQQLAAFAVGLVVLATGACTGPPVILPPPDAPDGVDTTALAGSAIYCGFLPNGAGSNAIVVFRNLTTDTSDVGEANDCGCYEDVIVEASPTDAIELYYLRAGTAELSDVVGFTADLGGMAPLTCATPCAMACP